jgi:hypothetical protein
MASLLRKRMRDIVSRSIVPELEGFVADPTARTYVKGSGAVVYVVDVQPSVKSRSAVVSFTVNCGVYIHDVVCRFQGRPAPSFPKITDCCLAARAGLLSEPFLDKWWQLSNDDESNHDEQVCAEMRRLVNNGALPFMARFPDRKAVATFLLAPPRDRADKFVNPMARALRATYAALIWRQLEQRERCASSLRLATEESRGTPIEDEIEEFVRQFPS